MRPKDREGVTHPPSGLLHLTLRPASGALGHVTRPGPSELPRTAKPGWVDLLFLGPWPGGQGRGCNSGFPPDGRATAWGGTRPRRQWRAGRRAPKWTQAFPGITKGGGEPCVLTSKNLEPFTPWHAGPHCSVPWASHTSQAGLLLLMSVLPEPRTVSATEQGSGDVGWTNRPHSQHRAPVRPSAVCEPQGLCGCTRDTSQGEADYLKGGLY